MAIGDEIKKEAESFFLNSKGSHAWDHTLRVYNMCLHIGRKENADMEILEIAAILHDIGREHQDRSNGAVCHAEKGAEIAEKILEKYMASKEKSEKILHCIRTHRFRGNNKPVSKEAKILFDADKLDSIGAIGIGRTFLFAGEVGAKLHSKEVNTGKDGEYSEDDTGYREFVLKLSKIKQKMLTEEGRRIAESRHLFMEEFFDRLNKETDGIL